MRQQILLGVGGMRALQELGYEPTAYHLNEGHAAFAPIERVAHLVREGHTHEEAMDMVKRTTVFTTHTPVPAGHDRYDPGRAADALERVLDLAGLSREHFCAMGRENPHNHDEMLCMTVVAMRMSNFVNGVAQLHGEVSREMWKGAYGCEYIDDVPIDAITNGIHVRTWLSPAADAFWRREIGLRPGRATPHSTQWSRALDANPNEFWNLRNDLRANLVAFLRRRLGEQAMKNGPTPTNCATSRVFDARRTHDRFRPSLRNPQEGTAIFRDLERIEAIVDNEDCPVQLIFVGGGNIRGRARPGVRTEDPSTGQAPQPGGRRHSRGIRHGDRTDADLRCDIWLNNPRRPHEGAAPAG